MTNDELNDYILSQLPSLKETISDWRPASDMYINDFFKTVPYAGQIFYVVPNGIVYWLKNGDSLIYAKKEKIEEAKTPPKPKEPELVACKLCGGKAYVKLIEESDGYCHYDNWRVGCENCGCHFDYAADNYYGREFFDKNEVISMWNELHKTEG